MGSQLQLERVPAGRLVVRRRLPSPALKRLAEHVWKVRGYQPYPELLKIAAQALDEAAAGRGGAVLHMPPYTAWGSRTEVTVAEVVEHLQLAGFAPGASTLELRIAAEAWCR